MSVDVVGTRSQLRLPGARASVGIRTTALLIAAAAGFVALRLVALANVAVVETPDTPTYEDVNFLGDATRLWVVPLLWKLTPDDTGTQVVLGIVAWLTLAVVTFMVMRDRHVAIGGFLIILALGLSASATEWDKALLSESVTFSALLLVASALLLLADHYSRARAAFLIVALTAWLFARHADAWLFVLVAPPVILALLLTRRRELIVALALPLMVLTGWAALVIAREDAVWKLNAVGVIQDRVLKDPDQTAFFRDRGLPDTELIRSQADKPFRWGGPPLNDPTLLAWVDSDFRPTYTRYLATHPVGTLERPARYFATDLPTRAGYTTPREVLPVPVRQVLWSSRGGLALLAILSLGFVLLAIRARVTRPGMWIAVAGVAVAGVCGLMTWHQAATELPRLIAPVLLLLQLSLLLALLFAVDGLSRKRTSERT